MFPSYDGLMNDRFERFRSDAAKIDPLVQTLLYFANDGYVVSTNDVQSQHHLLYAIGGIDSLVTLIKRDVGQLVKSSQNSHDAPAIVRYDCDTMINEAF